MFATKTRKHERKILYFSGVDVKTACRAPSSAPAHHELRPTIAKSAQPVDGSVAGDQRRRPAIPDEGVVFDRNVAVDAHYNPGLMQILPFRAMCLAGLALTAPLAAQDRTVELLQKITDAAGAPGFEEPIRKVMVDAMRPYATTLTFDGLGSILATQGSTGPRIMVDAHMDELGGVVRRVTPRGLLTMQMLGG
jgi:hypothetical protein